jgi:RNA-binding protein 8A
LHCGLSFADSAIEGWVVFVSGVHDEAQQDDLYELFADFGEIKEVQMNLDRRTGYVKGYALIEFDKFADAAAAIEGLNGTSAAPLSGMRVARLYIG